MVSRSKSHRGGSRCVSVLVDHTAEDLGAKKSPGVASVRGNWLFLARGRELPGALVWPMLIEVPLILGQDVASMVLAQDEGVVENSRRMLPMTLSQ
jgi:hypothetical protein